MIDTYHHLWDLSVRAQPWLTDQAWATEEELAPLRRSFTVADLEAAAAGSDVSDWPVSSLTAPYGEIMAVYRELIADLAPAERDAILTGTARRVYFR